MLWSFFFVIAVIYSTIAPKRFPVQYPYSLLCTCAMIAGWLPTIFCVVLFLRVFSCFDLSVRVAALVPRFRFTRT